MYCVLPFGLGASAGAFTAFVAKAVRYSGLTVASIVYIDDFGCAMGPMELTHWLYQVWPLLEARGKLTTPASCRATTMTVS